MIRDNKRLQYQFTDVEKASMIRICQKFPHYNDVQEIGNTLATEGSTVLTVGQASILSGLVRPCYPPLVGFFI